MKGDFIFKHTPKADIKVTYLNKPSAIRLWKLINLSIIFPIQTVETWYSVMDLNSLSNPFAKVGDLT